MMMQRGRSLLLVFICFLAAAGSCAQSYYTSTELGVSLGASQYFGDLNDNYGFKTISPAVGIYARKHLSQYIAVKAVANYTHVGYDDKYNSDPYDKLRNLNFQSNIFEVAAQAEFNFFKFITGDKVYRFTPYLTGGVGAFYYNPYTYYNGVKTFLRPLGTEGQNAGNNSRKYSNWSACFPIGIGAKMWLTGGVNLTLEIADRLTATDYLDDVSTTYVGTSKFPPAKVSPAIALQDRSGEVPGVAEPLGRAGKQRGNSSSFDQYLMAQISISVHFTTYRCPGFMNNDLIRVR